MTTGRAVIRRAARPPPAAPGETRQRPAADDVEGAGGRARPFLDVGDQQLGELVAVAIAPGPWIAAQQALGARRGVAGTAAHADIQFVASRRRPTSVTRACAARCALSAVAPTAVSR